MTAAYSLRPLIFALLLCVYAVGYSVLLHISYVMGTPLHLAIALWLLATTPFVALWGIIRLRRQPPLARWVTLTIGLMMLLSAAFWGFAIYVLLALTAHRSGDWTSTLGLRNLVTVLFLMALPLAGGPAVLSGLLAHFFLRGTHARPR